MPIPVEARGITSSVNIWITVTLGLGMQAAVGAYSYYPNGTIYTYNFSNATASGRYLRAVSVPAGGTAIAAVEMDSYYERVDSYEYEFLF